MKRLRFQGDAKSVFRALDVDCSGSIGKREFQILNGFHGHRTPESGAAATRSFKVESEPFSAKGAGKAVRLSAPQSQPKRSSSTPSLFVPERPDALPRPGESNVLPLYQQGGDGYPHKSMLRTRPRNRSRDSKCLHKILLLRCWLLRHELRNWRNAV